MVLLSSLSSVRPARRAHVRYRGLYHYMCSYLLLCYRNESKRQCFDVSGVSDITAKSLGRLVRHGPIWCLNGDVDPGSSIRDIDIRLPYISESTVYYHSTCRSEPRGMSLVVTLFRTEHIGVLLLWQKISTCTFSFLRCRDLPCVYASCLATPHHVGHEWRFKC